jgi:hypothetical protein
LGGKAAKKIKPVMAYLKNIWKPVTVIWKNLEN